MARRAQGEGSISRRSDGRWQGSIQVNGKRQFVYGKTQGEVAEKLRRLAGQAHGVGQLPSAGSMTVAEYLKEWLSQAETRLRPTTYRLYEGIARLHVSPHIGTVKLSKLAPLNFVRLYAELTRAGLSARRVQQLHLFLNKALGDAVRWGLIGSNPVASAQPPRPHRKERELWRPEQIRTFLTAVEESKCGQYGYLFGFLLASGCRVGEALGLRWTDLDLDARTFRIERSITWIGNRTHEGPPKTRSGIRSIVLPGWAVDGLRRQRSQVLTWRLKAGGEWSGEERVFPTSTGGVPSHTNLRRSMHALCEQLGLPLIRIHDLRHLSISLLAMAGVPVKIAQARAGHSSATITMQVYSHVLGDGDRQAAEALERAFG